MQLAKRDLSMLGLHSLLGGLLGLVYGSVSLYNSRRVGSGLRVQTQMLGRDTTLHAVCSELERMKPNSLFFHRCINTTDQLLYLRYGMSDGIIEPAKGHEEQANELVCLIRDDLKTLREDYEKTHEQKDCLDFSRLISNYAEIIDGHCVYVTRRTIRFRQ